MTETRMLRYNFTPEEHLANCELARLFDMQSEVDSRNKSIEAQLKEDEESAAAEVGRHVRFVRDMEDFEKQQSLNLQAEKDAPLFDATPAETAILTEQPEEFPAGPVLAPTHAERKKARDEETARKKALRDGGER